MVRQMTLRTQHARRWAIVLLLLGAAAVLAGVWQLVVRYDELRPGGAPPSTEVVTYSTDSPSERPFDEAQYTVAADQPRMIRIERVGIQGVVQRVGVDQHGDIAVPNTTRAVGWYVNSAKPGERGLSIIDGHVQGRYGSAIFSTLREVRQGDEIVVTYGDTTERVFRVREVVTMKADAAAGQLFAQLPDVAEQLNLITCIGAYNTAAGTFDQRVIVKAALVR